MYLGRILEVGLAEDLFRRPLHPYTRALLAAVPEPTPNHTAQPPLLGELGSAVDLPPGCRFAPRCPLVKERCHQEDPALQEFGVGHQAACHFAEG
jgi:oligopeptide/dipeptide ABC transporter ATP-binding protein